jgi:hypothetical protein
LILLTRKWRRKEENGTRMGSTEASIFLSSFSLLHEENEERKIKEKQEHAIRRKNKNEKNKIFT